MTSFGLITLLADCRGLTRLFLPGVLLPQDLPASSPKHPVLREAARQLQEYDTWKRKQFDLALSPSGTRFQRLVWQAVTGIPFGSTATYRDIAVQTGDARRARAVGAAVRANPLPIIIPCHRIIGSNGRLTGFSAGIHLKKQLLVHEGIPVERNHLLTNRQEGVV